MANQRFEPWFGAFPPEPNKAEDKLQYARGVKGLANWILDIVSGISWLLLLGLIVVGVTMRYGAHSEWDLWSTLFMVGTLGLTIDLFLKRRLAREAMEAAFGYALPQELRDGMRWFYGLKWLCVGSTLEVTLIPDGDGLMSVTTKTVRTLKNVTNKVESLTPFTTVNERLLSGKPSRILRMSYWVEGENAHAVNTMPKYGQRDKSERQIKETELSLMADKAVRLGPGEKVTIETESTFYRNRTDMWAETFVNPTVDPEVVVNKPEDIGIFVGFGNLGQAQIFPPEDKGAYHVKGTLLPYQVIDIHWWDKKQLEEFKGDAGQREENKTS